MTFTGRIKQKINRIEIDWWNSFRSLFFFRLFWPVVLFWFALIYDGLLSSSIYSGPLIDFPAWLLFFIENDYAPWFFFGIGEPLCTFFIPATFLIIMGGLIYAVIRGHFGMAAGYLVHIGLIILLSETLHAWLFAFIWLYVLRA